MRQNGAPVGILAVIKNNPASLVDPSWQPLPHYHVFPPSSFLPLACDWLGQKDERGRIWGLNWGVELVIISPYPHPPTYSHPHMHMPQGTVTLTVISVQKCHTPIMPWALISICAYLPCPITMHLQTVQRDKGPPLIRSATISFYPLSSVWETEQGD